MTSAVDLSNRALAEIASREFIASLDEASVAAANCKLLYEPIRKQLLRQVPWGFARTTVTLALLGSLPDGGSPYPWSYRYAYPSDCLRILFLSQSATTSGDAVPTGDPVWINPGYFSSQAVSYVVAADGLLTNVASAVATYTADVVNPEQFDSLFEEALVFALAAKLVGPVTGEMGMKSGLVQQAELAVAKAQVANGNETPLRIDHTPDWIAARSGGTWTDVGLLGISNPWGNY